MKPKILIVSPVQFGYSPSIYYYCKYLKSNYSIFCICWDHGLNRIEMSGVSIQYISRKPGIVRVWRLINAVLESSMLQETIIFISYFKGISTAIHFLRKNNPMVLDIRTGSIEARCLKRCIQDSILKIESKFFKNILVLSKSLSEKLKLSYKANIIPLGADIISSTKKTFESLHLLYVGTLFNRNIEVTIHGFKLFYDAFKDQPSTTYTIIGSGPNSEVWDLRRLVSGYGLSGVVKITGNIPHTDLAPYFDTCNIGVSYVPLTDYYDCQPVTKTFEYLLSGIPVIATRTSENKKVIHPENGVVVGETAENFYTGLREIFEKRQLFDSATIRNTAMSYTWESIVSKKLKPYLQRIRQ